MAASSGNGKILGRFDPIHIGLAIISVIFLILSIVFIILFATKHDSSTGFLTTGFSSNTSDEVSSELKGLLNKKYTVNSFAAEVKNNMVSAVFSLRDSVSTKDVQSVLSGSKLVTQVETTYGDTATAVCRQEPAAGLVSTTTVAQTTSVTTAAPPVIARYCKSNPVIRDIVITIDMDDNSKGNYSEKIQSLTAIRDSLIKGLTFPQANVFLNAVVGGDVVNVSTAFVSDYTTFIADFNKLLAINNYNNQKSLNIANIFSKTMPTFTNGRAYVPGALFIVTDNSVGSEEIKANPKDNGIYVGITGVNKKYIDKYGSLADTTISFDSWTALANNDPFKDLVCSFYKNPTTANMASFFKYPLGEAETADTTKCEVLDIIIAFDISESLSRIILPKYVTFAKNLVAQYKYKGNDFTRVGVITFNDQISEKLTLTDGNNLAAVNAAIDSVGYVGGLTDVTSALITAKDLFQQESDPSRSKVLIVLSDAVPTVDTYQDEIKAGQDLTAIGAITFFVGYNHYSDEVTKELGKVTSPDYVFGDMSQASFDGITNQILKKYPCPQPKCVTAYYAVEISEATNDYVVSNLKNILAISNKAATMQTGTESYQLITYNDIGNTQINPKGDASLKAFQTFVQSLIDNQAQIDALRRGYTRLDKAIDDVTAELKNQAAKNSRFSGNILFMGQANDAVLNPNVTETQKIALLVASAANLKAQTAGLIYVVDDSRPAVDFGDDLWTSVTTKDRIIQPNDDVVTALDNSDYFNTWKTLSCSLPALGTCYDTPLDVAVIIDLQNKDYNFINYITTLLTRFSSQDDTHVSMFAYGSQKTSVLSNLAARSTADVQNMAVVYEDWRNGTFFITTTTPVPTTTEKPKNIFTNDLYIVDQGTMKGVFDSLGTQFGCGHYSDDGDRIFAPNLFIFASDNFGSYNDAVWGDFQTELHSRYGCWDCAGTPSFLFLSRNDKIAPANLGLTFQISDASLDIDATDDTSTQANINLFNSIVNSVCIAGLPTCSSFTTCTVYA